MKTKSRLIVLAVIGFQFMSFLGAAPAARTSAFATDENRLKILEKIDQAPWAQEAYGKLKKNLDTFLNHQKDDPHWLSSRLFMHWESRATTTLILDRRQAGAEGQAPVPTPMFDGARDWATDYRAPTVEKLKPHNEQDGKIWLEKKNGSGGEWVAPGQTGEIIGGTNASIMRAAADAAFLYWLTKDEAYAQMAADVLWTYAKGFSYVTAPKYIKADNDPNQAQWLGATSFEVIRERALPEMARAYDYLYPYLASHDEYDVNLIQAQMKRMADRIIAGGSKTGNWNIKQNYLMAYMSQVLDDDAAFEDRKGKQYYTSIILNANLPAQAGINYIIANGFDKETHVFPEAPQYAFDTTRDIIRIAYVLMLGSRESMPLQRMMDLFFAQRALLYPNWWSVGIGDTAQRRLDCASADLLLSVAVQKNDKVAAARLADFIQNESKQGLYRRAFGDPATALTQYVADIAPYASKEPEDFKLERVNYIDSLSLLIQRNLADDPQNALAASLYGSRPDSHLQFNGLAMELYGCGMTLGADPGSGESYFIPEHRIYYVYAPAHNTVIPNACKYAEKTPMKVELSEPAKGGRGISPNISVAQATLECAIPEVRTANNKRAKIVKPAIPVAQKRTLAIIRTGTDGGFYLDVFRSKNSNPDGEFQDYLYHNIGTSMILLDDNNKKLPITPGNVLAGAKNGYEYFKNEYSVVFNGGLHAIFGMMMPDKTSRAMAMWLCGTHPERQVFYVQAPACHAAGSSLPQVSNIPMPTLVVRQQGSAWDAPFVAVFEPKVGMMNVASGIRSFGRLAMKSADPATVACVVDGRESLMEPYKIYAFQAEEKAERQTVDDRTWFKGTFGVVIIKKTHVDELYLADGSELCCGALSIASAESAPINAGLRQVSPNNWGYSASGKARVSMVFYPAVDGEDHAGYKVSVEANGKTTLINEVSWKKMLDESNKTLWVATCELPQVEGGIIKRVRK